MSTVTRSRHLSEALAPPCEPSQALPANPAARHEEECPERAACPREAPESRSARQTEAPDAGHGRANYLEHEFTSGRSQS